MNHADVRLICSDCRRCPLHKTRTQVVHSRGSGSPRVLLVGEAPGAEEDACGEPFRGRSGQLLDAALSAAGYHASDYRITNAVRCRPPGNRRPTAEERAACRRWLDAELAIAAPWVMVALGATAAECLLGRPTGPADRGQWHWVSGRTVRPEYHPAYLLRRGGRGAPEYTALVDGLVAALTRARELAGASLAAGP